MKPDSIKETERYCHEQIRKLQEQYLEACKPFVEQLIEIRNIYPDPIFITDEQAAQFLKK